MSLEIIRLSKTARDQLVWIKRHTGISHWNVLCRWALAVSLKDPSTPLVREIVTDSNVEMSWRTFAGEHGDIYMALIQQRCVSDGEEPTEKNVANTLLVHLHRGVGYLHGMRDMRSINELIGLATK
ncbi:DNA sulfur modification protein DndE [Kitasatospora sp. NPDC088783]|uniref:DNA sulfur modification protein DndE n=1 Tax=Kitasatospora sp. NPDC088783 TaxID=3364077 RepID=UPI00381781B7